MLQFILIIYICFYNRKAETDRKEMKLLLDMYKEVSKDQRDKVQLMVVEKKLQIEIEKLKQELKKIQVQIIIGFVLNAMCTSY